MICGSQSGGSEMVRQIAGDSLPRKFLVKIGFKKFAPKFFKSGWDDSLNVVLSLLEPDPAAAMLDTGCGDGEDTLRFANRVGTKSIYGIDIIDKFVSEAQNKGIVMYKADLNGNWPIAEEKFDVVVSNQVIEHLWNTELYISEMFRTLKPGGYAVIATENLASWPNILALLLGYQPFTTTCICSYHLGNPLIWHLDEPKRRGGSPAHIRALTCKGLKDLFLIQGFQIENLKGAGYIPFTGRLSKLLCALNPSRAHFIVIKVRKPMLDR